MSKRSSASVDEDKPCAIKVVVRARPLNDRELQAKTSVVVSVSRTAVQVVNPVLFVDPSFAEALSSSPFALPPAAIAAATNAGECRTFNFDRCFGAASYQSVGGADVDVDKDTARPNQELIFEEIGQSVIDSAFQGFNCTMLAYGQTGSGKTHTMVGDKSPSGKGVIPRVCEALFREIDARRDRDEEGDKEDVKRTIYSAQVSYCEIYKEKVNDLLDNDAVKKRPPSISSMTPNASDETTTPRRTLKVREHPVTGPFVEGLSSRSVTSYADIAEEMLAGEKLRTVASTLMNSVSSRSHAVFTITFTQTTFDPTSQCANDKTSKISMIDLAGSERANVSGTSGDRLKEGAMINKSLTTLGRVISALSKQATDRIPYRDSTLTWLLKESLGGNAKTTMFAMISPASDNYDETMSTLRYAESAKKVMNRAVVNEDKNARIIRQLRQEIEELRVQLANKEGNPVKDRRLSASLEERELFYAGLQKEVDFFRSQQKKTTSGSHPAIHLSDDLPSLINMNTNMGSLEALAYGLVEGTTVFGTDPRPDMEEFETVEAKQDDEKPEPNDSVGDEFSSTPPPPPEQKKKKRHGSWTSTMLRRRKSGPRSAPSTPNPKSPNSASKLDTTAVVLALKNSVMQVCKLHSGDDSEVLPRHVQFICTRTTDDTADEDDSNKYTVELESLNPTAMLWLNGEQLEYHEGQKTKLHHGDQVRIGKVFCFRLHVPGCAVSVPRIAEIVEQPVEVDLPKDNGQDLEALVNEANAICEKLVLSTEFALGKDPNDSGKETVVVTKKLEANCCSTVHWDRTMLEMKLQFLREFAASLENAVSFTNVAEELPKEEELLETDRSSKVDIPRQPSHSTGTEQLSSPVEEKPRADKQESAKVVHYIKPKSTHSLRYLGHGRIFLAAQSMGSSVPLSVAIYDFSGVYIGMLETQLEGLEEVQKRGVLASRATTAMHRIRIRLEKMEFVSGSKVAASDISITLKETSSKAKVKAKTPEGKKAEIDAATTPNIFSTSRIPPVQSSSDQAESGTTGQTFSIKEAFETTIASKKKRLFNKRSAEEDSLLVEVWGYNVTLARSIASTLEEDQALPQTSDTVMETQQVEFYVSVDVEEREADGLYHPVAVKQDGALRLHANRSRRLMIRVTQSDPQPFALSEIMHVQIAAPDAPSVYRTASMSRIVGKSTQRMLPSSSRMLHGHEQSASEGSQVAYPGSERWQILEFRGDCGVDNASRSLNAILRWDRAPESDLEPINIPGARSVYRLAIAFTTRWSKIPIVISKGLVTKVCGSSVTQKLARGLATSRNVWWAKESYSRSYRLGTWYAADVMVDDAATHPKNDAISDGEPGGLDEGNTAATSLSDAVIARHINGLHRLEMAMQLERVRQKVLIVMKLREGEGGGDVGEPLTAAKVNLWLEKAFEGTIDEVQAFDSVQFDSPKLFIRHLRRTEMLMDLATGKLVSLDTAKNPSTDVVEETKHDQLALRVRGHVIHFVSEPTQLVGGDQLGGEMSGFLMISEASALDEETAAAVVAPLGRNVATPISPTGKSGANRGGKIVWERHWFVLKRPFLYAYQTFAQKHQTGVMDLSMCQLVVSTPSDIPFSFRLVCLDGRKQSAVWWLQASTSAEMRAWLVSIDPLKIEARQSVVSTPAPTEVPALTA
ncbi:hypothetical protein PHYBOEH_000792 [Phytophthora boehmeriae]|uniref:Kinesin-like protein n=1 Tax=Phytophthora boehmeriae TaxID=109152 RepID=A0A8T1WX71_9STRA|nr:hypothetical protein PHYBOEH_000792 [Phytophthora boehmeriae]